MDTDRKYTLITGGSLGIGRAMARECARHGMNLLLVAKQLDELEATAAVLRKEFPVRVEVFETDLSDLDAPRKVFDWCRRNQYRINILINNAGLAGTDKFEKSTPEYIDERILVNIRALVMLTHLFIRELKSHDQSHILNVGSLSAYFPIAHKSVYAASKAFVLSFSRALRQELWGSGIRVTVVNPNGVRTNAKSHDRIEMHSRFTKRYLIFDAGEVARISIDQMLKGKGIVVPGLMNRLLVRMSHLVPASIRDRRASRIIRRELAVNTLTSKGS